jgi:hypothetical protein
MTLVGRVEVIAINIPLRGDYLGCGLTIMTDSPVHNRGGLSSKDR